MKIPTAILTLNLIASDMATTVNFAADIRFENEIVPLFSERCFQCHGEKKQKGDLRLDNLVPAFADTEVLAKWERIRLAVADQEMPPDDEVPLSDGQRDRITDWIDSQIRETALAMRHVPRPPRTRRLTVSEYNLTLQELFGVKADFAAALPPDPISGEGYQNDVSLLSISALQMEYYLEIARTAVERLVGFESAVPIPLHYRIETEDVYYTTKDRDGTMKKAPGPLDRMPDPVSRRPPVYATPLTAMPPGELPATEELRLSQPKLHQQYIPLKHLPSVGDFIVRVRAAGTPGRGGSVPRLRLEAGVAYGDGDGLDAWRLGETDVAAPMENPGIYEFRARLEDIPKPKHPEEIESLFDMVQLFITNVSRDEKALYGLGPGSLEHPETPANIKDPKKAEAARKKQAEARGRIDRMIAAGVNQLHLDSIEVEIVPGAGSGGESPRWQVKPGLPPREAAGELLGRFLPVAWRHPVQEAVITEKLALFDQLLAEGSGGFEESLRETLVSALVSPRFLLLETPDSEKSNALANRLAYFLWSAPPDERLRKAADAGELVEPKTYGQEARRILEDPRAGVMLDDFCRQWLRLDRFPLIAVNPEYFPGYDDDFAEISLEEPLALFREVFASGAGALDLIDPGYAMLNNRLARHYGLPPVVGGEWRKVALPSGNVRGGLVGQASLLTMNADGVDSHPIRRGVWIVDRLLGNPPPPPPPNVPDLDENNPDFRGLSLKQRIEKHREPGRCSTCHQRFDSWGIALENFDAIGQWRETITADPGKAKSEPSPVDADTLMPDGTEIRGASELIRHLRDHDAQRFTRSLVYHLMTYATGRKPDLADRLEIDEIHDRWGRVGYSLNDLILAIAESDAFKN